MNDEEIYRKELLKIFSFAAKDLNLLNEFLIDILTPNEYHELTTRWQIIKELNKGTTQREISRKLGVSISKITRGSRELADDKGGFRKILKLLSQKR